MLIVVFRLEVQRLQNAVLCCVVLCCVVLCLSFFKSRSMCSVHVSFGGLEEKKDTREGCFIKKPLFSGTNFVSTSDGRLLFEYIIHSHPPSEIRIRHYPFIIRSVVAVSPRLPVYRSTHSLIISLVSLISQLTD